MNVCLGDYYFATHLHPDNLAERFPWIQDLIFMSAFKMVSHNVFWFQGVPYAGDNPDADQPHILSALKDLYQKQDADLFCFQEIQSDGVAQAVAESFMPHVIYSGGMEMPQYGGATLSRHPIQLFKTNDCTFNRLCQLFSVHINQTLLSIANVHLPSSRHLGKEGSCKKNERNGTVNQTFFPG